MMVGFRRYGSDDHGDPVVGNCDRCTVETAVVGPINGDEFVVVAAGEQFFEQRARRVAGNLPPIASSDGLHHTADACNQASEPAVLKAVLHHNAAVDDPVRPTLGVDRLVPCWVEIERNGVRISCPGFSVNRDTKVADSGSPMDHGTAACLVSVVLS
ncbi:hypothetical protein ACFVKB_48330 [Rhodococcus sp. NPDC127530]|uniref:hypothetical protein n=1 Tax=unclassified Rhodococcus (in: high G+C Gram-positive bacteria) TaxID=192944 RepID=UPI003625F7D9